ncbi:hypothetical protein [Kitasatospora terrestris]|uniref:Ribbon-helix-helix protein CopG domain-containing protein n=1 Tax=Kitasatospora terrestris TaxID=258051 RepID=A0ABP9E0R6_9ACTN
MSPSKTLYVRDDDAELWARAEAHAKETRRSVSQVVADALQEYLPIEVSADDLETIEVQAGDDYSGPIPHSFRGKWLVAPNERDHGYEAYDLGTYWGVAITAKGKFVTYTAHCNDRWVPSLTTHDSLKEAVANLPDSIASRAAAELGQKRVVALDI